MDIRTFRDIPGYPGYRIMPDGTVYSGLSGRWRRLKPRPYQKGCGLKIALRRRHGEIIRPMLGRLVLEAFEGPCPDPSLVCVHLDGDLTNCQIDNLRWGTRRDAIRLTSDFRDKDDRYRENGHHARRGESHRSARLTEAKVIAIRAARRNGATYAALAQEYGVCPQAIASVVLRVSWKHVPEQEEEPCSA